MSPSITQPRQPKGVPVGGQWATTAHTESSLSLLPTSLTAEEAAERHTALLERGYVPAVAAPGIDPSTTAGIERWWGDHFVTAEYRATGEGFAQMPDDATPSHGGGNSLAGHRRTHRVRYRGDDIALRMPSATAIKRFAAQAGESTFDVPVAGEYPDGAGGTRVVSGWVRATKSPVGRWTALGMGFPAGGDETVAEAVSAVLEARRPTHALRDAAGIIDRHRARLAGRGADLQPVTSQWISAVGYDEATGIMATQTANGRLYGHLVTRARFEAVAGASSPGAMFNRLVKGSGKAEVERCAGCGRFFSSTAPHTCPAPTEPVPGVVRNELARSAATALLAARARSAAGTPPPRTPAPPSRSVDARALLAHRLTQRTGRTGMYGAPGWTVDVVGDHVQAYTDEVHVPLAYHRGGNGDNGLLRFAGLGGEDARAVGARLTRRQLSDRQNGGPTVGSMLAAAARNAGAVEVHGYVVGPDREDERVSLEGVYLYDRALATPEQVLDAARSRYGFDHDYEPDEVAQVEVPWRPGERAWRLWWD